MKKDTVRFLWDLILNTMAIVNWLFWETDDKTSDANQFGVYSSGKNVSLRSKAHVSDAYKGLPAALQAMVDKVYSNAWGEQNAVSSKASWDAEYAKRFRVQMYESYSTEDEATLNYLKIYENSNMDNPTGIYANNGDLIYIMVEGEIADGAELWLTHQNGHGVTGKYNNSGYTKLKPGLNAVMFNSDYCQLWIAYVVHTFNPGGATIQDKIPENRKLTQITEPGLYIIDGKKVYVK